MVEAVHCVLFVCGWHNARAKYPAPARPFGICHGHCKPDAASCSLRSHLADSHKQKALVRGCPSLSFCGVLRSRGTLVFYARPCPLPATPATPFRQAGGRALTFDIHQAIQKVSIVPKLFNASFKRLRSRAQRNPFARVSLSRFQSTGIDSFVYETIVLNPVRKNDGQTPRNIPD